MARLLVELLLKIFEFILLRYFENVLLWLYHLHFLPSAIVTLQEGLEAEEEAETAKAEAEEATSQTMNHKEAMRLDVMMDLTFSYIHSTCYQNGMLSFLM